MPTWLKMFWTNLKRFRLPEVVGTALGGIVIGVLGNGTYDCIKELGKAPPATATVSRSQAKPYQEGFVIDLLGRPAMLITESAELTTQQAYALQAAFVTKQAPAYQVHRGQNVLRIASVYATNLNGNTSFSSPGCFNTYLVSVTAELSGPDFGRGEVTGSATLCGDKQPKDQNDFINEDVLPKAVAKLTKSITPNEGHLAIRESADGKTLIAKDKPSRLVACIPCWLWSRGCSAIK